MQGCLCANLVEIQFILLELKKFLEFVLFDPCDPMVKLTVTKYSNNCSQSPIDDCDQVRSEYDSKFLSWNVFKKCCQKKKEEERNSSDTIPCQSHWQCKEEELDIGCVINMTRTLPIALYGHMLIWPFFNLWPLKERSEEEVTMDTFDCWFKTNNLTS